VILRLFPSLLAFMLACIVQPLVASDPVAHMLVQFPLLAAAGYLLPRRFRLPENAIGPALVLALVAAAIWMLPRSVDAALESWGWHLAKFTSLPLAFGFVLSLAWPGIGPVLGGFLKAQAISMLLFLAFLYTHAPVRICNSYLVEDQYRLGHGFAFVAVGLALWWVMPVFTGHTIRFTKVKAHEHSDYG